MENAKIDRNKEVSSRTLGEFFGYSRETGRRRILAIKKKLGISGLADRRILWGEYCDFYKIPE
jgi:hypothetical protein